MRNEAIRTLTQSNELPFRPASDHGLHIFDNTWFSGLEPRG